MESWRKVWRKAAPLLSRKAREVLREALASDDPRLAQGATTVPPPMPSVADWPVEAACLLGYCGWQGEGLTTVAEVEEYFSRMCYEIDQAAEEPAAVRWLLNWYDETPRDVVRRELLAEVNLTLSAPVQEAVA
jgi:hypothetical protein